jgi:5-methylcytosine-specific restriction endonuclease McrBC regulatory subunit McrC
MKPSTPLRSKAPYLSQISLLSKQYDVNKLKPVTSIQLRTSDPAIIKETKEIGMRILQNNVSSKRAWRIDYSEFFERYVQYVLKLVAGLKGAKLDSNKKYRISGEKTPWTLSYLEPDAVMYKGDIQYVIDAKYKSHMYNVNRIGEDLKETFREDFHQVLAYSSFGGTKQKHVMLIYPSNNFISREINVHSGINGYSAKAYLVGIPLKKSDLEETKQKLSSLIIL